jgi:hypothetical protein
LNVTVHNASDYDLQTLNHVNSLYYVSEELTKLSSSSPWFMMDQPDTKEKSSEILLCYLSFSDPSL